MPKHPDFEKILNQFAKRYGKERGEKFYYSWLNKMQLDDTKPYGTQKKESFAWAKPHIAQWKESEPNFTYWKVEAAFPVSSMNRNVYTEAELKASARTLVGKPLKQNHEVILTSDLAKIVDAEYEDGAVEAVIGIDNTQTAGKELNKSIEQGLTENPPDTAIVHVSLEADCKRGIEPHPEGKKCCGLVFTALSLLDKAVLPGIPLTKFYAAESFTGEFEGIIAEGMATTVSTTADSTGSSANTGTAQVTTQTPNQEPPKEMPNASAEVKPPESEAPKVEPQIPEPPKVETPKAEVTPQADNPAPTLTPDITPEIPDTSDSILTQAGFWDRFNLYHDKYNVSRQDSFRLVAMDMIKHLEKGKKKA